MGSTKGKPAMHSVLCMCSALVSVLADELRCAFVTCNGITLNCAIHCWYCDVQIGKYSMELIQLQGPQGGVTVSYCSSPFILYL